MRVGLRILSYAGLIGAGAIGTALWDGTPLLSERTWIAVLLVPVFAFLVWLRWDWAPREGQRRREARRARAKRDADERDNEA